MKIKEKFSNNGQINIIQKIPLNTKRIYFLNKLKKGNKRFGHAHKKLEQIYICIQGSFLIKLVNRKNRTKIIILNEKNRVIKINKLTWREIEVKKNNSILLVLASEYYDKEDYIRNFKNFIKYEN